VRGEAYGRVDIPSGRKGNPRGKIREEDLTSRRELGGGIPPPCEKEGGGNTSVTFGKKKLRVKRS